MQVEAYSVEQEGCPLICRFATMGTVRSIRHSQIGTDAVRTSLGGFDEDAFTSVHAVHHTTIETLNHCLLAPGDYLVTIEEKNSATYLRAYTNWRYQVNVLRRELPLLTAPSESLPFSNSNDSVTPPPTPPG